MKLRFVTALLFIILTLLFAFSGCSDKNETPSNNPENAKLKIVTSFYPVYLNAINVTKDAANVSVENLTDPSAGCLHDYQLTTKDMKTLETADALIINGAGMEPFIEKVASNFSNIVIIDSSKNIELLPSEGGHDDHADEDVVYNSHAFLSLKNAKIQINTISEKLIEIDPANKSVYEKNSQNYIKALDALDKEYEAAFQKYKGNSIASFHETFSYLAKDYNLNMVSVIEKEPEKQPSASELKETISALIENDVKIILTEPQYSSKTPELVAKETNASICELDSITAGEINEGQNYNDFIDKMRNNLAKFSEAINQ